MADREVASRQTRTHAHTQRQRDQHLPNNSEHTRKEKKTEKKSEKIRLDNKKVTRYWPPGERHWRVDFRGTEFKSLEIESTFVQ